MSKMKQASQKTITRKMMASAFVGTVSKKIWESNEFTMEEKEAAKWAVDYVKKGMASWSAAGRSRARGRGSRDALYLREYRARLALQNAKEKDASPLLVQKLEEAHRAALEEYKTWKAENGLEPELKTRPARS